LKWSYIDFTTRFRNSIVSLLAIVSIIVS